MHGGSLQITLTPFNPYYSYLMILILSLNPFSSTTRAAHSAIGLNTKKISKKNMISIFHFNHVTVTRSPLSQAFII